MSLQPSDFGPVLGPLVDVDRRRPLDAGSPSAEMREQLRPVTVERALAHTGIADHEMAQCCLAGVWLLHDFLDESHTISQAISTPSGSFWHGVMHRREGDFSNAKYWFRRVGSHEVEAALGQYAAESAGDDGPAVAAQVAPAGQWDPVAFVDACQTAVGTGAAADYCRRLQQQEWELLFESCYRRATAVG